MLTFETLYATLPMLLILLGAVFVHACFQLSVSVLTLLSSHTIGRRLPNARLLNLNFWYILGSIVTRTVDPVTARTTTLRANLSWNVCRRPSRSGQRWSTMPGTVKSAHRNAVESQRVKARE